MSTKFVHSSKRAWSLQNLGTSYNMMLENPQKEQALNETLTFLGIELLPNFCQLNFNTKKMYLQLIFRYSLLLLFLTT